jgi:hypothetical protein
VLQRKHDLGCIEAGMVLTHPAGTKFVAAHRSWADQMPY